LESVTAESIQDSPIHRPEINTLQATEAPLTVLYSRWA